MAATVLVDHGRGPTYTHDAAYADITTQVHAWTRSGATTVRLMVEGLPPGRTFGAPDFGIVSSSGPARQIQLGARLSF